MRLLAAAAVLAGVYALALASAAPLDLAAGVVVGGAVLLALRGWLRLAGTGPGRRPGPAPLRRAVAFPAFASAVLVDVAVGTWDVALRVLHLRPVGRPGIVLVPIGERTPTGLAVTALALTLSPGSVLIDVDRRRGVMEVHLIDASDPAAFRARVQDFYERRQRAVFP